MASGQSNTEKAKAKAEANDTAVQAKEKAGEVKEQAKDQARSQAEQQKSRAEERLGGVAQALHKTSDNLREQDEDAVARYVDNAAGRVEGIAGYLRERSPEELLHDAEDFARRDPALFLGGAFTLGLLGARFLKSSGSGGSRRRGGRYQTRSRYEESGRRTGAATYEPTGSSARSGTAAGSASSGSSISSGGGSASSSGGSVTAGTARKSDAPKAGSQSGDVDKNPTTKDTATPAQKSSSTKGDDK